MNRAGGVLLSITSLPSKYGIGCFSQSAYDFVDWLQEAGQTCRWDLRAMAIRRISLFLLLPEILTLSVWKLW